MHVLALGAAAVLVGAIATVNVDSSESDASSSQPTLTAATLVAPTKVAVFIEENHSYAQMKAGMPNLASLANKYGYATNWTAITHPSLPNYLSIVGGSTFGVTTNNLPASNAPKVGNALSVFDAVIAAGQTAKSYVEGMPTNCSLVNNSAGKYAVKHNPWAYFGSATPRANCNQFDVPLTSLAADTTNNAMPNVGVIVPNLCNDAHNCSLTVADNWLKPKLTAMLASNDFLSGRLVVVVTADEDDKASGNKVFTVVMHASLNGVVVSTPLTHYSLTRFFAQITGTTPLLAAKTAPDMKAAFGL